MLPKLPTPLKDAALTEEFFYDYQTFFRFIVFDRDIVHVFQNYTPVIKYNILYISDELPDNEVLFGELNNDPIWILEDETPKCINSKFNCIDFLFQMKLNYEFLALTEAPRQKVVNYENNSAGFMDSFGEEYNLFVSNELYFFGIKDAGRNLIYVVPQS